MGFTPAGYIFQGISLLTDSTLVQLVSQMLEIKIKGRSARDSAAQILNPDDTEKINMAPCKNDTQTHETFHIFWINCPESRRGHFIAKR